MLKIPLLNALALAILALLGCQSKLEVTTTAGAAPTAAVSEPAPAKSESRKDAADAPRSSELVITQVRSETAALSLSDTQGRDGAPSRFTVNSQSFVVEWTSENPTCSGYAPTL